MALPVSLGRSSLAAVTLGLCACALDERQLLPASGDGGAAAGRLVAGEAGASEGQAAGGEGSLGGSSGAAGDLVDGCADLDTDGVADCTTTLLENPTFTSDVSGWTATGGAELTWDPKNALSDLPSGSAKLSATSRLASAWQCVSLGGEQLVIAYASAFVEAADVSAGAQLEVSFFAAGDCSGEREGYFETPPSAVADAWTTIQAGGLSKATTRSVSIALVGIKPASASELSAYFDNVMLKAQQP